MLGVFVVKLMVAKTDEDRGNFCESLKPSGKAFKIRRVFDVVEGIDKVASNEDIVRFYLIGLCGDGVKGLR